MHSKGSHKQKIQPMEWEKKSVNDATNNGLIFKIHKQLIQLIVKAKTSKKQPNQKWADTLYRHFSKENIENTKGHMERCSI